MARITPKLNTEYIIAREKKSVRKGGAITPRWRFGVQAAKAPIRQKNQARTNRSSANATRECHGRTREGSARRIVPASVAGADWPSGSNLIARQFNQSNSAARLRMKSRADIETRK